MKRATKKPKAAAALRDPAPMPTMTDVARVTGFSQMTVSRAFLRSASIRVETKEAILKAAAEIGYFHNKAASTLASDHSRAFGIILPTLQDSIYVHFVEGARSVFEREGREFLLQSIDYTREREPAALAALLSQRVRAILLPSIGHTREMLELLQSLPIPIIEFGNLPKRPVQYAVGHSDREAGHVAARHLIERGAKRIGIICGVLDVTTNARDRLNGFRAALRASGSDLPDHRIVQVEHSIEAGLEGLESLLDHKDRVDGLVVGGEIWSAAILLRLLKRKIRVPEDLAVIGIGDVEIGPYLPIPLSCVALPRFETGAESAALALALAEGHAVDDALKKLPVDLVRRASA